MQPFYSRSLLQARDALLQARKHLVVCSEGLAWDDEDTEAWEAVEEAILIIEAHLEGWSEEN